MTNDPHQSVAGQVVGARALMGGIGDPRTPPPAPAPTLGSLIDRLNTIVEYSGSLALRVESFADRLHGPSPSPEKRDLRAVSNGMLDVFEENLRQAMENLDRLNHACDSIERGF